MVFPKRKFLLFFFFFFSSNYLYSSFEKLLKVHFSRCAYAIVQQRRFCINPNEGFMAQLREYEPIYQAQKTLKSKQQCLLRQTTKRTIHQMDTERTEDKCDTMDS